MISRADFVFTIGYEGDVAVVDGALKRRYGSLDTDGLLEAGLYKQALCSVVYQAHAQEVPAGPAAAGPAAGAPEPPSAAAAAPQAPGAAASVEGLRRVLEAYNRQAERKVGTPEQLKRLFGVFEVPAQVSKVMVI